MTARKIYQKLLAGSRNVRFEDLCKVAKAFGYRLDRTRGSHHIFENPKATRPLNLQVDRGQAKPYQIRQFLRDIEEFQLTLND
jgi:predicted RNA binding protein YcfA (HicA-like mRNA interferase family)